MKKGKIKCKYCGMYYSYHEMAHFPKKISYTHRRYWKREYNECYKCFLQNAYREKMERTKLRTIPHNLRVSVLNRDKSTCQLCGSKAPDVVIEIDHIIPFSKGGETEINNLQCLCFSCNRGKNNGSLHINEKKQKSIFSRKSTEISRKVVGV